MKKVGLFPIVLTAAFIMAAAAHAKEACVSKATAKVTIEKSAHQMAYYSVPDLTKKKARKLSKAIAKQPGLVSAKPDLKNKTLSVVFATGKTTSKDILSALVKVSPKTTFEKVVPVDAKTTGSGCGACPSKGTCPSQQKSK